MIRELDGKELYKEGHNPTLDERYSVYRRMNIFAGDGVDVALSDGEGNLLAELWVKERETPWKMQTREVSNLVYLSERVTA